MTTPLPHGLGCRPDLRDRRDDAHAYHPVKRPLVANCYFDQDGRLAGPAVRDPVVDLRPRFGPPRDQEQTSSCVGFACAAAVEFLFHDVAPLSAWWAYFWARLREDCASWDAGCSIRDCLKEIHKRGIPPEVFFPFKPSLFAAMPCTTFPTQAEFDAAYKAGTTASEKDPIWIAAKVLAGCSYHRVRTHHIVDCLAEGFPVVAGIPCYPSMFTEEVERTGIIPMPGDEGPVGGHAILVVGTYEDQYIFRNSWNGWGDGGNGYLPQGYEIMDAWTVRKPE